MNINITEVIPTELSGYCDIETGECITPETGTSPDAAAEVAPRTDDDSTVPNDSEDS